MESESQANYISEASTTVSVSMKIFFAGTSIGSLFMSVLFVYLVGMVNGLQILAITCLFQIRMPSNAMSIMIMVLHLAAFDLF